MKNRLLPKSETYLGNILDYAWKLSKLSSQEVNLAKNKEKLRNPGSASYKDRVKGWIAKGEYEISVVKQEIKELEDLL